MCPNWKTVLLIYYIPVNTNVNHFYILNLCVEQRMKNIIDPTKKRGLYTFFICRHFC
jgi:hypothetical protein